MVFADETTELWRLPYNYKQLLLLDKLTGLVVMGRDQCDQIGRFLKVLGVNFITKVDQIFGDFLSFFEEGHV